MYEQHLLNHVLVMTLMSHNILREVLWKGVQLPNTMRLKKVFQCRAFLGLLQENILYTFLQKGNIIITVFPKVFDHKAFVSFFVFVFPNSTYKTLVVHRKQFKRKTQICPVSRTRGGRETSRRLESLTGNWILLVFLNTWPMKMSFIPWT